MSEAVDTRSGDGQPGPEVEITTVGRLEMPDLRAGDRIGGVGRVGGIVGTEQD